MSSTLLYEKAKNFNNPNSAPLVGRYLRFIESRKNERIKYQTHLHHILPKAKDFFPEYSNLKECSWNGVYLTVREHFIAHWMLARAFPKSSQAIAFYNFCNTTGKITSRSYEESKRHHVEHMKSYLSKPERCKKISDALKGKPKSEEYKKSVTGHTVSEETREKLRRANLGKKWTDEQKANYSKVRTGLKKKSNPAESIEAMRATKLSQNLKWCNNGVTETLCPLDHIPERWVLGKIQSTIKGKRHYNNGVESRLFLTPPDDSWKLGRITKRTKID